MNPHTPSEALALLSTLAARNAHLTQLSTLLAKHDKAIGKSIEKEEGRVKKTLKRLDLELKTKEMTSEERSAIIEKQDKILAMQEKYDYARALKYPNIMKKLVLQKAAEKLKKTAPIWLREAKEIMCGVEVIDKEYSAKHASALNKFLNKDDGTLKELNDYCASHGYSDDMHLEEQKTGLMFALATLDAALTPEYLINLTTLTLPNLTTQKESIDHLMTTITGESVEPLLNNYKATKSDNPISAIAILIESLRMHITFPDNKIEGGGEFYLKAAKVNVNETALRILYYRECMAAGIPPAKINDIFMTEQSILRAHQPSPKAKRSGSIESMGVFSHKDEPRSSKTDTEMAKPRQKK